MPGASGQSEYASMRPPDRRHATPRVAWPAGPGPGPVSAWTSSWGDSTILFQVDQLVGSAPMLSVLLLDRITDAGHVASGPRPLAAVQWLTRRPGSPGSERVRISRASPMMPIGSARMCLACNDNLNPNQEAQTQLPVREVPPTVSRNAAGVIAAWIKLWDSESCMDLNLQT